MMQGKRNMNDCEQQNSQSDMTFGTLADQLRLSRSDQISGVALPQ